MGRKPCCEKRGLRRGKWDAEEDQKLINYINANGQGSWRSLPTNAGLLRCGKSCRLRWINYLQTGLRRGSFTPTEDETIVKFHNTFGNKWSLIASQLPGRTDNEIKNYWNSHLSRRTYMFTSTAMVDPNIAAADHIKIKNLSKRKTNVNKSAAASAKIKKNDTTKSPPVSDCTAASASSSSRKSTDNNGGGDERETGSSLHDDSSSLSRSTCMDDIIGWVNEFMLEEREAETNEEEMVAVWDENMLLQFESFLQDGGGGDQAAADCSNRPMMNDDEREKVVINSCTANKAEEITNLFDEAEKDYGSNLRSCPSPIVIYFNDDEEFHTFDFDGGLHVCGDVLN